MHIEDELESNVDDNTMSEGSQDMQMLSCGLEWQENERTVFVVVEHGQYHVFFHSMTYIWLFCFPSFTNIDSQTIYFAHVLLYVCFDFNVQI